ncbi:MAG: hypothetical protein U5Q44_13900 [Dehalococcoidia bacterium]|nr:hypothetical protein [Dehalococcoidia bacterium]
MANEPPAAEGLPPAHERLLIISRFAGQAFLQAGVAFFVLGTLGLIFVVSNEGDIFGGQAAMGRPFWRYIYTILTVWPPVVLASAVLAGVGIGCRLYGEAQPRAPGAARRAHARHGRRRRRRMPRPMTMTISRDPGS